MFLGSKIKQWFKEAVQLDTECDPELKAIILREPPHEKVNMFFENLSKQFKQAESLCLKRGLILKEKTLQETTYDMAKFFMRGMEGEAKRRYESDLEKSARDAQAAKIKEFDDVLAGNATGEFAEAGIITDEKIDKQREQTLAQNDTKEKSRLIY